MTSTNRSLDYSQTDESSDKFGEWESEEFDQDLYEDPADILNFVQSVTLLLLEKVIPYKPKALTLKKAGECLGVLGKIWNLSEYPPVNYKEDKVCDCTEEKLMDMEGYVDDYQYLHIEAVDLDLTSVTILPKYFVWLLSADFSGNLLTNETACPITKLPNLVALKLNRNKITDPYMPSMKHLQYLGLNSNKINSLHRIYHPNLETLDVNFNRIKAVDPNDCYKLSNLKQLELRGNLLTTISGIEYLTLVTLYLAQNQITDLNGIDGLVNLERLHLRDNPLSDLSGFSEANSKLKYLNIRKCQVAEVEEIKKLSVLSGLRELIVKGNAFNPEPQDRAEEDEPGEWDEDMEDEDLSEENEKEEGEGEEEEDEENQEIRIKILTYLPNLTRIDKKFVTKEELKSMKEILDESLE